MSMKLRASHTSPYARKVRAVLIETGLDKSVEIVDTDPWAPDTDPARRQPVGPGTDADHGRRQQPV